MKEITITKNDKEFGLSFDLQNNDGTVFDLTGGTLKFKAQKTDATALSVDGVMSIVDSAVGKCKYTVQSGDFVLAGDYHAEIEVVISSQIVTFTDILIHVKNELPRSA